MLRLWMDAALSDMVSKGGAFDNPLQEADINGDTGETRTGDFRAAIEQADLAATIDDVVTTVTLSQAMFFDSNYPVILCGTEKMLITAGFGTTTLTVTRGHNSTTAAGHTVGAKIYSAYNATEISISSVDLDTPPDESGWLTLRDYGSGTYESPHTVADTNYNQNTRLDYKVIIPVWPAQYKIDLTPRLSFKLAEIPNP